VHLQRVPTRKLLVEAEDLQVEVTGDVLQIRGAVKNLSDRAATDVRARAP
jgi:HSP20 family molecular chaperone IbpA